MRSTILLAAALGLAACSGGESANNESSGGSAAVEPTPTNLTDDPQNSVVPIPAASPSPLAAIPPDFQGHWGMVSGDCDAAQDGRQERRDLGRRGAQFADPRG